jgi:hypothetical protein
MQRAGQLHRRRRRCRIDAIGRAIGVDRSREVTGGSAGIAQIGAEGGAGGIGQDRAVEQRDRPRRIPQRPAMDGEVVEDIGVRGKLRQQRLEPGDLRQSAGPVEAGLPVLGGYGRRRAGRRGRRAGSRARRFAFAGLGQMPKFAGVTMPMACSSR